MVLEARDGRSLCSSPWSDLYVSAASVCIRLGNWGFCDLLVYTKLL